MNFTKGLFFFFSLLPVLSSMGQSDLRFQKIKVDNEDFKEEIICMVKDSSGFLWIGTPEGLYKYDGYEMLLYRHDLNDGHALQSSNIKTLFVDSRGTLWIGTIGGGLSKYNEVMESFETFTHEPGIESTIGWNDINDICEDKNGMLWIAFRRGGLDKLDPETGIFVHYKVEKEKKGGLFSNDITCVFNDSRNNLWLGTWKDGFGMINLNNQINHFVSFFPGGKDIYNIGSSRVYSFTEDDKGNVFIGLHENGFKVYNHFSKGFVDYPMDKNTEATLKTVTVPSIVHDNHRIVIATTGKLIILEEKGDGSYPTAIEYTYSPGSLSSIISPNLTQVFIDEEEVVWLASDQGLIKGKSQKFRHVQLVQDLFNDYKLNNIVSFTEGYENEVLIGTWGQGIWTYDYFSGKASPFQFPGIHEKYIRKIYRDSEGNYIVLSPNNGFYFYNSVIERSKHFNSYSAKNASKDHLSIIDVIEFSPGEYLLATAGGLYQYTRNQGKIIEINCRDLDNQSLPNDYFNALLKDSENRIWVGTLQGGLNLLVSSSGNDYFFKNFMNNNNENDLKSNRITAIYEDSRKRIWIGTSMGINKVKEKDGIITFKRYSVEDGLPSDNIMALQEDENGKLWISTDIGISTFDPGRENFVNYSSKYESRVNEFGINSSFRTIDGKLMFGGNNGFYVFEPSSIEPDKRALEVVITELRIFDDLIKPGTKTTGGREILKKSISRVSEIELSHLDNSFSLDFSALEFTDPMKIKYAYKLEGLDQRWQKVDAAHRRVTYTRIPHGNYSFLVKCTNTDGIWNNNPTRLDINITPPFWKTNFAIFLYILFITLVGYMIRRITYLRTNMRNNLKFEKIMREKEREDNKLKLQFYTNISHEFKTPLTLILDPVEQLLDETEEPAKKNKLSIVHLNTRRLLNLINQLMDFRKIDAGKMSLSLSKVDLIRFCRNVLNSFSLLAKERSINLIFEEEVEKIEGYFDVEKVDKILFNLISNAFKAEKAGGIIILQVKLVAAEDLDQTAFPHPESLFYVQIKVTDNGRGIKEEDLNKIFERFYQGEENKYSGTGIGLAIAKEFVECHKGKISVKSRSNEGTIFTVMLPLYKNIPPNSVFIENVTSMNIEENVPKYLDDDIVPNIDEVEISPPIAGNSNSILIVEDNIDLRKYLVNYFRGNYNVLEAGNGKEAMDIALAKLPDLIISDIMMPEMDGWEFCAKIKNDFSSSHIPVVLLTALASSDDITQGHETGADAFVPKPFTIRHLRAVVTNLLDTRRLLRDRFSTDISMLPKDVTFTTRDQDFIEKATGIVQENIENSEFDIMQFSEKIAMSRSHLFRKIKGITNQSPSEFIRTIRLKYAAQMLLNHKNSISEIAYSSGFASPAYFTQCFKKHFNMSPRDYMTMGNKPEKTD